MPERYNPAEFESKWQARWKEADLFKTVEDSDKPKFYGLDFFPYPSGAGLSVGHCRNYIPTDVLCRMKRMQGYSVLHPMGFDAFGLPAENEAITTKSHPEPMVHKYGLNYRRQMDLIGVSYDWSRSFWSSDPNYYKWTQWIFEQLFKSGLAYRRLAAVNWDPVDKTVLADEEIVGGRAERSGALVEKRFIPQWFFKITEYAQRLIDDLDTVDWPEGIKQQQRNWIGRSEGCQFQMEIAAGQDSPGEGLQIKERTPVFEVFTTRIDTVFGMTFCVLAPEHPLMDQVVKMACREHARRIEEYREAAKRLSENDRLATTREKTGVFTGLYAINPFNKQQVPIWIADYVLATYGTGAIMAVPGHDDRDFEFATKFGIDVVPVISPGAGIEPPLPFVTKDGFLINSGSYTGLAVAEAQEKLGIWLEDRGLGQRKIQYRLRDWLISRQRYWGCPIPIIHTKDGEMEPVPESQLPVLLPSVESYAPGDDGSSPLAQVAEFVNCTDADGRLGQRETDTMGGFACSSWYFLRFCDPFNDKQPWNPEIANYWMPVDCYVGGAEHAVMHLLYARFWTKFLHDQGLVKATEPFQRLMNQGQVLSYTPFRKPRADEKLDIGEDGILITKEEAAKLPKDQVFYKWVRMSKSRRNVVTPDEVVAEHGADALRVFLLFVAPFSQDVQWNTESVTGAVRFLNRVFRLVDELLPFYNREWHAYIDMYEATGVAKELRRRTHQTIKKSSEDIERFAFNTYISAMMTYVNELGDLLKKAEDTPEFKLAASEALESLILLLAPAAPHSGDELWEYIGNQGFTFELEWPTFDPALAIEDVVTIAVQVNGKLRDTLELPAGVTNEDIEAAARASSKVAQHLEGKEVRKVVIVPGKLANFVVA
ncbi:MAG: leucine--tRNA ligase [Armatimonadetes bacterium]|nr:leucine--tRNA ligase [Armatimonadota bacterium]